jgi:adenine-specific DNA glycosylase
VFFDKRNKKVYLKKRIEKDIWFNLYDFHLTEYTSAEEFKETIKAKNVFEKKHLLTHQTLHVAFSLEEASKDKSQLKNLNAYSIMETKELPMPILHEKYILDHLGFLD